MWRGVLEPRFAKGWMAAPTRNADARRRRSILASRPVDPRSKSSSLCVCLMSDARKRRKPLRAGVDASGVARWSQGTDLTERSPELRRHGENESVHPSRRFEAKGTYCVFRSRRFRVSDHTSHQPRPPQLLAVLESARTRLTFAQLSPPPSSGPRSRLSRSWMTPNVLHVCFHRNIHPAKPFGMRVWGRRPAAQRVQGVRIR